MELREIDGFDEDGNPTTIKLPTPGVIKQALLNLDYSNGAISNRDAQDQLADQFCLSDEQKTVLRDERAVPNLWRDEVNGEIQALVREKKLVRLKRATIITPEGLIIIISLFFKNIGYGSTEIDVVENHDDTHFSAYMDIGTQSLKFSVAYDPTSAPADA